MINEYDLRVQAGKTHLEAVQEKFPNAVTRHHWVAYNQLVIDVEQNSVPDVVAYLYYERGGWLPMMVANDERRLNGHYALYYILSMEEEDKSFILVRELVDRVTCEYPAVSAKVPAAVWSEREAKDLYGLRPVGGIDDRPLVIPDDWPAGVYPLRKDAMDYRYRPAPTTDLNTYEFLKDVGDTETTEMPQGPMHITSDEPAHFRLFVEGETIIDADYRMFFVHRGMEKCAESRMTYDQAAFLAERICGICGFTHSTAYCGSIEHAQQIEVPLRAKYIRAIVCETERIHSDLLNIGLVCHYIGFDTGFQHFFRVREKAMDLAELITGGRKTYGVNIVGGVRRDLLKDQTLGTLNYVREMRTEVENLEDELMTTANFHRRTKGVGLLDKKICRDYSPVGPMVRGSGFARDERWNHPFDAYEFVADHYHPNTQDSCDVYGRTLVRLADIKDSINMIEEFLSADLPDGPVLTEGWEYKPYKYALSLTEAPRGENCHFSMLGDDQKVYRWRGKAATYSNWPVLRYMFRGNTISDAPLIVGSLDPCYSCTDRVTIIDVKKQKSQIVSMQSLEEYSRNPRLNPLRG